MHLKEIFMDEIRYFMEESILSITPGATAKEAAELMRKNSISSLLVGEAGHYSGFLTDTDLTRKLVAKNRDPEQTSVAAIASASVISMDADRSMAEAYACMKEKNIRHLAISDNDNITGILSIKDFANYYHNKHSQQGGEEKGEIQYFMQNSIVNIESYETVLTAAQKMADKKVGALLVTEMGKAKGILSESALTMDVIAQGLDFASSKVSSVLSRQLVTIEQSQSMSDAYQLMRDKNVRHLFATRGKKIVGMLSIKDFANYYNFKFCKKLSDEDRVKHYMQENLETIDETLTVLQAAEILKDKEIGSLLVKEQENIIGIVTEEDFARNVLGNNLDPAKTTISQVMRIPCKLDENQHMDEALALMHENDVRYIAITSKSNVKGIISLKDLTVYYKQKYINTNELDESAHPDF
ncbi:MAG: CBS domain-containing protein [Nitrospinales bacterium]